MWFGYCQLPPVMKTWTKLGIPPPGFFKYARSLELSLSPDFPALLLCASLDLPGLDHRHDVYDFHWLRLDKFQNLRTLHVWISARSLTWSIDDEGRSYNFTGITEFDMDALRGVLNHLQCAASVTLSTPLGPGVGPHHGYVEGVGPRVYKRGSGDRFHPPLYLIEPGGVFDNIIHTSPTRCVYMLYLHLFCVPNVGFYYREVRLSRNGGVHLLMKGV